MYATKGSKLTQKSEANEDLRVRRTRKMLQEALMSLTVEKGFAAITVNDISERAMVNRSTFYRHYLDKYDLLDQYMNEVYELTSDELLSPEKLADIPTDTPPGPVVLLRHIQKFADFYRVMLGPDGHPAFCDKLRQNTERRFRHLLSLAFREPDPNTPPNDLRIRYISHAGIGAILWWLENDQPCTAEQLASWLGQLSTAVTGLPLKPQLKPKQS